MGYARHNGERAQGAFRIGDYAALQTSDTVEIGDRTYEFGAGTPGNVQVAIGASDAATATNLKNAINGTPPSPPITARIDGVDDSVVRLEADEVGPLGNHTLVENMTGGTNIASGSAMTGGENPTRPIVARGEYTVTALDVAAGNIEISTGRDDLRFPTLFVRDSDGVPRTLDGEVTVDGGLILIAQGLYGAFEAGDVIEWLCFE